MKSKYSTITFFLKGCKRYFILAIFFVFLQVVFDLINPKIMGYTVDYIVGDTSEMPAFLLSIADSFGGRSYILAHLWLIALIVIGIGVCSAISRYLFQLMNSMGGEHLARRMRDTLFKHILHLPYKWHDINKTGDIIQRCTSDVDMIRGFIQDQLVNLFRMIVTITLALIFMIRINVVLTLCACFFIIVVIVYSMVFHGSVGEKFEKVDAEEGRLSAVAQENLAGVRVVRAFGREKYERTRFETKNEIYINHWIDMMRLLTVFWTVSDFVKNAQMITIMSLGAYFTVKDQITAGQYVSFIAYNLLIVQPMIELGRVISEMSKAGVSIGRLKYIIDSPVESDKEDAVDFPGYGDIIFENVSFAYEKKDVLKDVSLKIKKGQTIGILGGTGSGKSTLMLLLDNLYDLKDGSIYINGVDISNIKRSELRKHIGFVLQEPYLFSRSLKDNILIASEDASDEVLERAVETSHLKSTILKFKEGFNTFVGERGVTLSGGQKQRTAIAQVLTQDPEIMIFDDSLSAVDSKTDAAIRKGLKQAGKDKTVIIISHRITTIMSADQIFVFDDGKVIEAGSHDELIKRQGVYNRIYDLQRSVEVE